MLGTRTNMEILSQIQSFIEANQYIISQVTGIIVCAFAVASMQLKNIKYTMFCQLLCNGLGTLSYVLIGGFSGSGIYLVATLQSLVFFLFRKYEKEEPRWIYPIIFAAYIGCSLLTFKEAWDIVPMIAALLCALALIQKRPALYRIIILLNCIVWIVYDIHVNNVSMLITHAITAASALLGIIRLDVLKK